MYNREIEGHSLWAWAAAAISAPAAQFLGSTPWHWALLLGLAAAGIWLCVEAGTVYGRRDWKPVAVLQILFLAFAVSAAAGWSGACWPTARQSWTIPVVLLVLGACAAEQGCRTGARCGAVLFWCLVLLFAVLVAFAVPEVEWRNLRPENRGDGSTAAAVLLLPAAAALLPRKKGRSPWLWGLGLAIIGAGVSLLTAGVLSPAVATNIQGAFFEMIRGISILGVAERFEAVVAAAMTLGWFCLLSLLLTAAGHLGETLHQGWGRPTVWLTALLAATGQAWAREVSPWFSALGALVFWCLLPLLGRRRAPVEKKNKI